MLAAAALADEGERHRAVRSPRPDAHLVGPARRPSPRNTRIGRLGPPDRPAAVLLGVELEERRVLVAPVPWSSPHPRRHTAQQGGQAGRSPARSSGHAVAPISVWMAAAISRAAASIVACVVPLHHHAGEGLGPRIAHQEPGAAVELRLPAREGLGHPAELVRAAACARTRHVQQHLWALLDLGGEARRAAAPPPARPGGAGARSGARHRSGRGRGR